MLVAKSFKSHIVDIAATYGFHNLCVVSLRELDVAGLGSAIIFYHGLWSGPSVAVFEVLCEALAEVSSPPDLVVIDADELNDAEQWLCEKAQDVFGPVIGAWGETCWVRRGEVMHREMLYWKDYEDTLRHFASGSYERRVPATKREMKNLILRETAKLEC